MDGDVDSSATQTKYHELSRHFLIYRTPQSFYEGCNGLYGYNCYRRVFVQSLGNGDAHGFALFGHKLTRQKCSNIEHAFILSAVSTGSIFTEKDDCHLSTLLAV